MQDLDWLLRFFDQPDVSEVVLGLGRPVAVRTGTSYRAVTTVALSRDDIEKLVVGTTLAGLIDQPQAVAPAPHKLGARYVSVELLRQGREAAIRITPAAAPPRTITPTAAPRTITPTAAPRTITPTSAPPEVTFRKSSPSVPPAEVGSSIPKRTTTPPFGVAEPVSAHGSAAHRRPEGTVSPTTSPPPTDSDQNAPTEPVEIPVEIVLEEWKGARIIDERIDSASLRPLLRAARDVGATDLHIVAGRPITIRRLGELVPLEASALAGPISPGLRVAFEGPLKPSTASGFLLPLLGPAARATLAKTGYVDVGFEIARGSGRVRGNVSHQKDGLAGSFRLGSVTIPTLDSLGLPQDLQKVVKHHQGLVVIAGPSGHGKTTTMAALVDLINSTKTDHIITIEDPVEIAHPPKLAIVSHREVGRHTLSFVAALKASLREDPDVIVIGELRDRESVEIALTAAETGHLVLATMSTPSATRTIDRLIDMFPPDDQVQVRASLSGTLRAVIAQRLLPNTTGTGMVAAIEVVTGVLPLAALIRDNKLFQLPNLMQRGKALGMIRLDDSLAELARNMRISNEVALANADNRRELSIALGLASARPGPSQIGGLLGRKGPP